MTVNSWILLPREELDMTLFTIVESSANKYEFKH